MGKYETINVEQSDHTVTVTLNRSKLNLFNSRMIEEMIDVDTLVDRFRQMDLGFEVGNRMATWTMKTSEELSA